LIEYSDFQCPACGFYFPLLKKLEEEFGENIAIVYRHFPLSSVHPNAKFAAYAAEAAGKQGKFWEMHDLIFTNQSEWSDKKKCR
jgi:protein-disulfide isomerase